MTAEKLWETAKGLMALGNFPLSSHTAPDINRMALTLINAVYSDLSRICGCRFAAVASLSEKVDLPAEVLSEALVYGLAMHIAAVLGDSGAQEYFAGLYNGKRLSLSRVEAMHDIFSKGESR